jgi:hypothetical protein
VLRRRLRREREREPREEEQHEEDDAQHRPGGILVRYERAGGDLTAEQKAQTTMATTNGARSGGSWTWNPNRPTASKRTTCTIETTGELKQTAASIAQAGSGESRIRFKRPARGGSRARWRGC